MKGGGGGGGACARHGHWVNFTGGGGGGGVIMDKGEGREGSNGEEEVGMRRRGICERTYTLLYTNR